MLVQKWIKNITIILVMVVASTGCMNDDKVDESSNKKEDSFLTATINGTVFSSSLDIVTFTANNQTYLLTADNKTRSEEYEFNWIINNNRDNDPAKIRYGFIELKNVGGDRNKNKTWQLPNNFNFEITANTNKYIEGTFSFTATPFGKIKDGQKNLEVTNGKFRANRPGIK
jgi:hypothetical protein